MTVFQTSAVLAIVVQRLDGEADFCLTDYIRAVFQQDFLYDHEQASAKDYVPGHTKLILPCFQLAVIRVRVGTGHAQGQRVTNRLLEWFDNLDSTTVPNVCVFLDVHCTANGAVVHGRRDDGTWLSSTLPEVSHLFATRNHHP
jgi:hypothetical protein